LLYPHLDYRNNDFNKDHIFPVSQFNNKYLKTTNVDLTQDKGHYYTENWCYNGIVNLQMLDSNDNKSKGDKTFEEWAKTSNINYEKQILPEITDFNKYIEFVDVRWDMLKVKLENALKF
jgi:hypothetical protein